MEEHAAKQTNHTKHVVPCPGCGQTLALDLNLSLIEGKLYMWFEGLCGECHHKIVDPLPRVGVAIDEMYKRMMSN
ncbi:MAG: hypothetical protein SVM79_00930 [Chloroflexota bacterium]|nr:hypothetical protein [Chloroflexota bacterium]